MQSNHISRRRFLKTAAAAADRPRAHISAKTYANRAEESHPFSNNPAIVAQNGLPAEDMTENTKSTPSRIGTCDYSTQCLTC
jgi:hypothetical protein